MKVIRDKWWEVWGKCKEIKEKCKENFEKYFMFKKFFQPFFPAAATQFSPSPLYCPYSFSKTSLKV